METKLKIFLFILAMLVFCFANSFSSSGTGSSIRRSKYLFRGGGSCHPYMNLYHTKDSYEGAPIGGGGINIKPYTKSVGGGSSCGSCTLSGTGSVDTFT